MTMASVWSYVQGAYKRDAIYSTRRKNGNWVADAGKLDGGNIRGIEAINLCCLMIASATAKGNGD